MGVTPQERAHVTRNGRVGFERQPELCEASASCGLGKGVGTGEREEPVHQPGRELVSPYGE